MKNLTIISLALLTLFAACTDGQKSSDEDAALNSITTNNDDAQTGSFSFDGKSVEGVVSTQYFGDKVKGNFSVLCQHDNEGGSGNPDFALLQITFLNESDAINNPSLKVFDGPTLAMSDSQPGFATITLSGRGNGLIKAKSFSGTDKTTGNISVSGRTITLKDVTLYNHDGAMKTVNATISF
jgi:hypothetical protein